MPNSLWNAIIGSSASSMLGPTGPSAYGQQATNYPYSLPGMISQTQQQYNNQLAQQMYNANRQTYDWVWNGRPVSITEFAELAYGDTSQRSMFLLKYSDKEK